MLHSLTFDHIGKHTKISKGPHEHMARKEYFTHGLVDYAVMECFMYFSFGVSDLYLTFCSC